MKVSLVVASGVHQGKVIPVATPQFLIGRDPQCQLRPASQSISKQHCVLVIRNQSLYLKDFGSTNGTFVNEIQIEPNIELAIKSGDRVRVGPLDFTVQISLPRPSDSTPLPEDLNMVNGPAAAKLKDAAGVKPSSTTQKPVSKPAESKPAPAKQPIPGPAASESDDDIAAMLLGMGDESSVPEGSTVFEMTAVNPDGSTKAETKPEAKKTDSKEDSSNAASDILRKYMRRPR